MRKIFVSTAIMLLSLMILSCENESSPIANTTDEDEVKIGPPVHITRYDVYSSYLDNISDEVISGGAYIHNMDFEVIMPDSTIEKKSLNYSILAIKKKGMEISYDISGAASINGFSLDNDNGDNASYVGKGRADTNEGLQLYFGQENQFKIGSTKITTPIDTSIAFFDKTEILNIKNGDVISRSSDLKIDWESTETDYTEISIIERSDTLVPPEDFWKYSYKSGVCNVENDGSYTFPAKQMQQFKNGKYLIILRNYTTYFLYDSNNKAIPVEVESAKEISVYFVD